MLCIGSLPLSVKRTPLHHHYFVVTLFPCSNRRRKSFPMKLAPRSPLTRCYPRRQGAHAKRGLITCRAKLLTADWLRQRALLVIKRVWLLDADWLSTPALNWFSAFSRLKRNASLLSVIWTWSLHLNVKENQNATKRSLLVGKAKLFFRPKTYWFAAWKQFEWGRLVLNEALDRNSWPPNWKLISRVATSRLISITGLGHLIGVKKQCKFCRYVTCSQWKGEFWIQEVIRARLDTCLRLSTIDVVVSRRCKLRNRKIGE